MEYTKGFRWGGKSKIKRAKEALFHAGKYAFRDRRAKKRDFRALWQTKINAQSRTLGVPYSKFIFALKQKNIILDRKILSQLAEKHPDIFKEIADQSKI